MDQQPHAVLEAVVEDCDAHEPTLGTAHVIIFPVDIHAVVALETCRASEDVAHLLGVVQGIEPVVPTLSYTIAAFPELLDFLIP